MSASLIGRLWSSAFRLPTSTVSRSLAGSCSSSESAYRAAKRRRSRDHASHGAFRFNRVRALAEGLGGESSSARKRACAPSSRKNVRWSRMVSSACRRALSNTNSESFWPRSAAARLRIAFASAEARIWIISSLRRADAGRASLLLSRGLCRKGKRDRFGHTAFGLLQIFVPVLVEDRALRVDGGDISAALTVDDMDHKLAQPPAAQM